MPLSEQFAAVTERTQIEQAARGSADALAGLFERHAAMVHRVAYRLMMSADDAGDLVQDVFVGSQTSRGRYTPRSAGCSAFAQAHPRFDFTARGGSCAYYWRRHDGSTR